MDMSSFLHLWFHLSEVGCLFLVKCLEKACGEHKLHILIHGIKYISNTLVMIFKLLHVLKKANKWLNGNTELSSHQTSELLYPLVHFYSPVVFIIVLLQTTRTKTDFRSSLNELSEA